MYRFLLVSHFIGFILGFTASLSNAVMGGLIERSTPPEKVILGRFPPVVGRLGDAGLVLLWITGPALAFVRYGGFAGLPAAFHAKMAAVAVLTIGVGVIHANMRKAREGDATAMRRIRRAGQVDLAAAFSALVLAVVAFEPA